MPLEFTKELFEEISEEIEQGAVEKAAGLVAELHPYDVAQVLSRFNDEDISVLFQYLNDELCAEILSELDESSRIGIITLFKPDQAYGKFLKEMDSDDAADIVNEMPEDYRLELMDFLRKEIGHEARDMISLLKYHEDSAGGLMAKELVRVKLNWTVSQCIEEIRKLTDEVEAVYAVYVVDNDGYLKGLVPLSNLILSKSHEVIGDFYDPEVKWVYDMATGREAAEIMDNYDLVALPVVDLLGRLVGRITIDDVVDYIREEAEEDYQLASGLSENVEYSDTVWRLSRARLPWLFLGLLGGIASSKVIGLYENDLHIHPEMAFFIPLIAAMGGNAGVQSSAIVVQSLANKSFADSGLWQKLSKEFMVSLVNGSLCAIAILAYGYVMNDALNLSITVSSALLTVVIIAAVLGAFIPLILNSLKIDPALATGPFITTTNDLLGLGIYFFIGRIMYGFDFLA